MAYVPSTPPVDYNASFLQEEFQRIANAYNFQRAVGELLFDLEVVHAPQLLTIIPSKILAWDTIGPDDTVSDGPILTSPRLTPDDDILILEQGVYQMGFYIGFEHAQNETFLFELYVNGIRTFIGSVVQASAGTALTSMSASAIKTLEDGDIVDLRGTSLTGDESVTMRAGAMFALKEMDKRTRVS